MKQRSNADGFTLIEVMVILAVLGVVLLAGAPNFVNWSRTKKLEDAKLGLMSHLDMARNMAISEHNVVEVSLDTGNHRYTVHDDDNGNGSVDTGERVMGPFEFHNEIYFDSVTLAGDGKLRFQPSGVLTPGQGGSIVIRSSTGFKDTLEVFNSGTIAD